MVREHDILVTMVTKWLSDPYIFLVKIHVCYSKGVLVPNLRKIHGVEIARLHYLNRNESDRLQQRKPRKKFEASLGLQIELQYEVLFFYSLLVFLTGI